MTSVKEISSFINNLLEVDRFDKDPSNNGLQIKASEEVGKIGFCVDASMSLFQKAAEDGCDMVVVHHGISWGNGFKRIVDDMNGKRIAFLFNNKLSLYAVHLPLDAHPEHGHNAVICKNLGLINIKPFAEYAGYEIGFHGELPSPMKLSELLQMVNQKLDTECKSFGSNSEQVVKTVGVVSGGAADEIDAADKFGLDAFITGEMNHYHALSADELTPALITAGHYKTEVPGIKAVMNIISDTFNVECVFYDLPTGL